MIVGGLVTMTALSVWKRAGKGYPLEKMPVTVAPSLGFIILPSVLLCVKKGRALDRPSPQPNTIAYIIVPYFTFVFLSASMIECGE